MAVDVPVTWATVPPDRLAFYRERAASDADVVRVDANDLRYLLRTFDDVSVLGYENRRQRDKFQREIGRVMCAAAALAAALKPFSEAYRRMVSGDAGAEVGIDQWADAARVLADFEEVAP